MKQDGDTLEYASIPHSKDTEQVVHDYFNLDVSVKDLYKEWCKRDPRFQTNSSKFQGIRILRQDPWENLISFICSSNNNVKRISKMCESLCVNYGKCLGEFQDTPHYCFPDPASLAGPNIEQELRDLGFGYRAKFINRTARLLTEDPQMKAELENELRSKSHSECQEFLLGLSGVGPKVADCVALMSLDKHEVVPIDTHVYQIATRDYRFHTKSKNKTMTKAVYDEIQQFFVKQWGDYAGWAHSLLFAADLRDLENGINDAKAVEALRDDTKGKHIKEEVDDEEYIVKRRPPSKAELQRQQRYEKRNKLKFGMD